MKAPLQTKKKIMKHCFLCGKKTGLATSFECRHVSLEKLRGFLCGDSAWGLCRIKQCLSGHLEYQDDVLVSTLTNWPEREIAHQFPKGISRDCTVIEPGHLSQLVCLSVVWKSPSRFYFKFNQV